MIDNGPGIPLSRQQLIFERFTQVHQASGDKPEGSGLGLYITKGIVRQHGGQIRVASAPLKGAMFEIELPLVEPE